MEVANYNYIKFGGKNFGSWNNVDNCWEIRKQIIFVSLTLITDSKDAITNDVVYQRSC